VKVKKSAGSALKIAGPTFVPNVFTFALCGTLTFAVLAQMGVIAGPGSMSTPPTLRQADVRADAPDVPIPR
jgi:hypothetical protein